MEPIKAEMKDVAVNIPVAPHRVQGHVRVTSEHSSYLRIARVDVVLAVTGKVHWTDFILGPFDGGRKEQLKLEDVISQNRRKRIATLLVDGGRSRIKMVAEKRDFYGLETYRKIIAPMFQQEPRAATPEWQRILLPDVESGRRNASANRPNVAVTNSFASTITAAGLAGVSSASARKRKQPSSALKSCEGPSSKVPATTVTSESAATDGLCVICIEDRADTALINCGHLSCCNGCAKRLLQASKKCPICRAPIMEVLKVYKVTALPNDQD